MAFCFALGPGTGGAAVGDPSAAEAGLRARPDLLFFSGFEADPWTAVWGMEWGPEPAANAGLLSGPDALQGRFLRVRYLKDTYGPTGGLQFLTDFSKLSIPPREALSLRYYVRFEPGFDFVKGGKLPGLAGGDHNTGGHKPNGRDGWSARMMWRPDGKIVQYVYHPDQAGEYGEDFAWDYGGCPRYFVPGRWYCVETYVRMNRPGKKDGVIRSWLNGEKALEVTDLRFRDRDSLKIDSLYFSTFFGGADASWAPPREEYADFDDFVLSDRYIGPDKAYRAPPEPTATVAAPQAGPVPGTLVFDGDKPAWTTSHWSEGAYDFGSAAQNHTPGGGKSALIRLPDKGWGGAQFEGPGLRPSDFKAIHFWVCPTGCDVEFRVRFESVGKQTGEERAVTGARPWKVGQWNEVSLPLADFKIPGSFDKIVLTSNSPKAVSPFYVDDVILEK